LDHLFLLCEVEELLWAEVEWDGQEAHAEKSVWLFRSEKFVRRTNFDGGIERRVVELVRERAVRLEVRFVEEHRARPERVQRQPPTVAVAALDERGPVEVDVHPREVAAGVTATKRTLTLPTVITTTLRGQLSGHLRRHLGFNFVGGLDGNPAGVSASNSAGNLSGSLG
jgi:hypothetical protein